jgi:hypothetical protein
MASYSFVTTWQFRAPIEQVWEAIHDYQAWPRWWPAIAVAKQIAPGDAEGMGEIAEFAFRTPLLYKVRFMTTTTHVHAPYELDGRATGDLEGMGRWRLTREGDETMVQYLWDVSTTRWFMNLLAPIGRKAFTWNHDRVMEKGRTGLERLLARVRVPS